MFDLPKHTEQAIDNYVNAYIPPGGFLYAVLTNNLMEAVGRADPENRAALVAICQYVYNHLPSSCWGSPAKVAAWLERANISAPQG